MRQARPGTTRPREKASEYRPKMFAALDAPEFSGAAIPYLAGFTAGCVVQYLLLQGLCRTRNAHCCRSERNWWFVAQSGIIGRSVSAFRVIQGTFRFASRSI